MATRDELVAAVVGRYSSATRSELGLILDEFVSISGHHRKHAMRLLRARSSRGIAGPRPSRRVYGEAIRVALLVV